MRARLLVLVALLAACRSVPLADPVAVAAQPRADVTPLAVRRALAREGFEILEERAGLTRASLSRRSWTMVIDVTWAERVEIHYVSSQSLGEAHRHGVRYIHHGYNERVQRLAESIAAQSKLVLAEVDPDAFLGPSVGAPPPGAERAP